jgi:hypothetical protein
MIAQQRTDSPTFGLRTRVRSSDRTRPWGVRASSECPVFGSYCPICCGRGYSMRSRAGSRGRIVLVQALPIHTMERRTAGQAGHQTNVFRKGLAGCFSISVECCRVCRPSSSPCWTGSTPSCRGSSDRLRSEEISSRGEIAGRLTQTLVKTTPIGSRVPRQWP